VTRRINEAHDLVFGSEVALTSASLLDFWRWAFSDPGHGLSAAAWVTRAPAAIADFLRARDAGT
jgi:hypothetical protein